MRTTRKYKILQIFTLILGALMGGGITTVAAGNADAQNAPAITVAAAADLQPVLHSIGEEFTRLSGARVDFVFGSSGNLQSQIENGAPFDVFLSADREHAERVIAAGKADRQQEKTYAVGKLVVWTPAGSKLDFSQAGLKALLESQVEAVSIANPEHAPYGRAAVAALRHEGIYDQLKPRLVLGENVAQAAQFASTGNAQAAMIAMALAKSPQLARAGRTWEVPASDYPPIEQVMVPLSGSRNPALAQKFAEFMLSAPAQQVLRQFGFAPPGSGR